MRIATRIVLIKKRIPRKYIYFQSQVESTTINLVNVLIQPVKRCILHQQ